MADLVYKVRVRDLVGTLVQEGPGGVRLQPDFPILRTLLGECELQAVCVLVSCIKRRSQLKERQRSAWLQDELPPPKVLQYSQPVTYI